MLFRSARLALVAGPAAADELGPGPGAEEEGLPDVIQAQPHRHRHIPQVHPDEGAADVQARVGPDVLHRHGALEGLPGGGGKGALVIKLRMDKRELPAQPVNQSF